MQIAAATHGRGMWEPLSPNRIHNFLPNYPHVLAARPGPPPSDRGRAAPCRPIHPFSKKGQKQMAKPDIDELAQLPTEDREHRIQAAAERIETRLERARDHGRDLTEREAKLSEDDRAELEALKAATTIAEHAERTKQALAHAIDTTPRPEQRAALADFITEVAAGRPVRMAIESRSITSAVAGARGGVAVTGIGRPEWLHTAAAIPFSPANELTISGPLYAALVAQDATPEGTTKPSMTDPTLATATLEPFAVVTTVSDAVLRFGVGPESVTARLASESVYSVNAAFAAALEVAAGTPVAFATSASRMADLGIATIWGATGAKPTALIVNPADYPALSDKAAVGPGDGVGAEIVRFNGVPLVVNAAVTSGVGVVVNGSGFSAHGTSVLFASLPNITENTTTFRAETYAALLQHDASAVVAVDLVTP
ncbi:MAG: hypothetical protein SV966_10925 [Actinomycetota bacterium]|nr:hypothetical protein [Actinomycetota bacterium]